MNIIITEEFENRVNLQMNLSTQEFNRRFRRCRRCSAPMFEDTSVEIGLDSYCACFNWGIGRELYTAPSIFVPAEYCNIENGKCFDRFSVEKIRIDRKKITGLCIRNDTLNCRCFVWTQKTPDAGGENRGSDI